MCHRRLGLVAPPAYLPMNLACGKKPGFWDPSTAVPCLEWNLMPGLEMAPPPPRSSVLVPTIGPVEVRGPWTRVQGQDRSTEQV